MQHAVRDGASLFCRIDGDPAHPNKIALVHSLAMDHRFWAPVAKLLARDACVLTYDCRGHGASAKPAGPYRVEQFADDLSDLLDALNWPRAVVAGASMGGCVALAFAQAYGRRVAGLALFDTTAWYGADAPKVWAERADKAAQDGLASLVAFQTTRWFSDAFRADHADVTQQCVDIFLANDVGAYAETCRMLGAADVRARLSEIEAPVRILVGEEDYATPIAMARALQDAIPNAALDIAKGARHLTPLEIPNRAAAEIRALL